MKNANIRECSIRGYLTKRIRSDRQLVIFVSVLADFADRKVLIILFIIYHIVQRSLFLSYNNREGSGGRGAALLASLASRQRGN